ncbi:hypothetical protein [Microbacterium sp. SS28]|uniref:hypothetical protein n=1 Tax=Microbacterium sp. SS28 TaxID=2919948 RepID=UPI001FAA3F1F|nr:hypothetical protein [Microbacterium sp. SS28]
MDAQQREMLVRARRDVPVDVAAREEKAQELLSRLFEHLDELDIESHEILIRRRRGARNSVILWGDDESLGEYLLDDRLLLCAENTRAVLTDALVSAGYEPPREALVAWTLGAPTLRAHIGLYGWGPVLAVQLRPEGSVRPFLAASCFFDVGTYISVAEAFNPAIERALRFHGVQARPVSPNDVPETANVNSSLSLEWDPQWWGTLVPPHSPHEQLVRRALTAEAAARVAPEVARAVSEIIGRVVVDQFHPNSAGHRGWLRRSGIVSAELARELSDHAPAIRLPAGWMQAWDESRHISEDHAILLTALKLRSDFPDWWVELPWRDFDPVGGDTRGPHPLQLTSEDIQKSTAPDLLRVIIDHDLFGATFFDMTTNDIYRLWLVAAVLCARLGSSAGSHESPTRERRCEICGLTFEVGSLAARHVASTRTANICALCMADAVYPDLSPSNKPEIREEGTIGVVRLLCEMAGAAVPRAVAFHMLQNRVEDRIGAAMMRMLLPDRRDNWFSWLNVAGVVNDGWRGSYGVTSIANDGHPCRSLIERYIDDFMSAAGIDHDVEPQYPYHPEFNPNSRLRADWELTDGTFVEAAGLMTSEKYRARMSTKRQLADACGFKLIVITESDLTDLDRLLES